MNSIPDNIEIVCKVEEQLTLEWCWLSVARAINGLTNPKGKQYTEGELANLILNRNDCTNSPIPSACVRPGTNQMMGKLYEMLGIKAVIDLPLGFNTCLDELIAKRVFQYAYRWYNGGGHTGLVTGYRKVNPILNKEVDINNIQFQVRDPWFGMGDILWLTYPELCIKVGVGEWSETIGRFSSSSSRLEK